MRLIVDGLTVPLVTIRYLPRGVDAITLPFAVLIRRGFESDPVLLEHEATHVRQWRHHGVPRFLVRYLGEYLKYRRCGYGHIQAYLNIDMECQARLRAEQLRSVLSADLDL